MGSRKEYIVPFTSLKTGKHELEYEIDDKFFEDIDYSEVKKSSAAVNVSLDKQSTLLVLDFKIKGTVEVPCDRCGDEFDQAIENEYQLIFKLNAEKYEEGDDVIYLPASEYEIEISQFIYEYILLSVPQHRVHPKGKCNKEVLKKLKELSANMQHEEQADPRWDALKNIKLN